MTTNSNEWAYFTPSFKGDRPEPLAEHVSDDDFDVEARLCHSDDEWTQRYRSLGYYRGFEYRYRLSKKAPDTRTVVLPETQEERDKMALFDGFMAYFPNAMAEVAKLSHAATQQHHPDKPMHWDRSKSKDHLNKIGRHMIDAGNFDDKGQRHSAALAWRAMANLQEELERDLDLPASPASRNREW